jgi:hypothetical protein
MKLLEADGDLFFCESQPVEWKGQLKTMSRLGERAGRKVSWVRIGTLLQTGVILGCKTSEFGESLSNREEAIRRLGRALRELQPIWSNRPGSRCRPVNSSRDWKPPKKPRRFERVGWVSVSRPDEVRDALATLGINCSVRHGTGSRIWDVLFEVPPSMANRVYESLNVALSPLAS